MLLLTGTSHQLRIVTGSAGADVRARVEWLENDGGTITPDSANSASITTATTTILVPSPSADRHRDITGLSVSNLHASTVSPVTVEHFDGTTACPLMGVTLLPGENLFLTEDGKWRHVEAQGARYVYVPPAPLNLGPTGTLAETIPRELCLETNHVPISSQMWLQGIVLYAGQIISNITLSSGATAAGTPTHCLAGIYDDSFALKATTADQLTAAWAANTVKTLALVVPYRVPRSGVHYVAFFMAATTVISFRGGQLGIADALKTYLAYPSIVGQISGAFTTELPDVTNKTEGLGSSNNMSIYYALS